MGDQGPRWLLKTAVIAMHSQLLAAHGGASGLRDEGLLDSALARPMTLFSYEPDSTIFRLAAAYAHSLCSNHAFVDGNKRIAFLASAVFLQINGFTLVADEATATVIFLRLASGELDLEQLTTWFMASSRSSKQHT